MNEKQIAETTNSPNSNPSANTIGTAILCVAILAGLYIIANRGYELEINTKDSTLKLVHALPKNSHPIAA